jgi:hypothetical protein
VDFRKPDDDRAPELVGEGWDLPDVVRESVDFHWFHVGAGQSLLCCVLSPAPVWYVGHYVSGRMERCQGDRCLLCAEDMGRQLRYILGVVELTTKRRGLLELGKTNGLLLRDWSHGGSGLRGLMLEVYRVGKSKHSRLDLKLLEDGAPAWALARESPDLEEALRRTWMRMESRRLLGMEVSSPSESRP